jgi:hypothetical protein
MKTDVNAPLKVISRKTFKKTYFMLDSCHPLTKKQDPDPEPYRNPKPDSYLKMSRIHNIAHGAIFLPTKQEAVFGIIRNSGYTFCVFFVHFS